MNSFVQDECSTNENNREHIEDQLRKAGWLIYSAPAYQMQLSRNHHLWIFEEGEKWFVWTGTYAKNGTKPYKEKVRKQTPDIYFAIANAHDYVKWFRSKQGKSWTPPVIKRKMPWE